MTAITDVFPALALRVIAGPLVLRSLGDDDLAALCELASRGIHPPDRMPFCFPWTEAPPEGLRLLTAQYHWRVRASFSSGEWVLPLGVGVDGVLVGSQALKTENFLVTKTAETGSWLGREFQHRGIGTAMRQGVCTFAFDHLGAAEISSGAFTDNPSSLRVSAKVGYRPNGLVRMERRDGELAVLQKLRLVPDDLIRGEHPVTVDGLTAFRQSIGVDPT